MKTPAFLDVFVVDSLKKVPSTFATFFVFLCVLLLFSNQLGSIQGTIFVVLLQALPRAPSVILITNCFTNGFLYKS